MLEEDAMFFMKWAFTTFLAQAWIFANIRKTGAGPQHRLGHLIYDSPGNPLRSTWWAWTFGGISTVGILYIFGFRLSDMVTGYIGSFGIIAQASLTAFCVSVVALLGVYWELEKEIDEKFWIGVALMVISGLIFLQTGYNLI